MSPEKFRPDPDLSIEIPTEKFRPSSGNIFIDQAERANPGIEGLKQKLINLTGQIGKLKEKMRTSGYLLNKEDVARLNQLGVEKDETTEAINNHKDFPRPTIQDNLTGRDTRVNKYR